MRADHLEALGEAYRPFADRLCYPAEPYQLTAILAFAQRYMVRETSTRPPAPVVLVGDEAPDALNIMRDCVKDLDLRALRTRGDESPLARTDAGLRIV